MLPAIVLTLGLLAIQSAALAQDQAATPPAGPEAVAEPVTLILVERAGSVTNIDGGETGPSAGDMIIWGPNPLYDETNTTDSGATTQGVCIALDATGQCMMIETIVFADGSTIELQGVQAPGSDDSVRTIVGGSGQYLGAMGTVQVEPSEDLSTWVKTFTIWT
jgi:hypothetical protein